MSSRQTIGRTAFLLLFLAPGSGPASAAGLDWETRLALEGRYDDNITQLSDGDIDRLDRSGGGSGYGCGSTVDTSGVSAGGRFTVTSPGDFTAIPSVDVTLRPEWIRGLPTAFDFDVTAYQYAENAVKNYQSYGLAVSQPLHRSRAHETVLRVGYDLTPSYYLRNLRSDRTGEELGIVPAPRREATYRKETLAARLDQELVPGRLRIAGALGREARDYNRCFDERDSTMPFGQIDLFWEPRRDGRIRLRVGYRRENLHAGGDLPDTVIFVEDDVSSDRDIWTGDFRVRWGKKGRRKTIRLRYEAEARDYTADDPNDIYHYGRSDHRTYLTGGFRADLRKGWFLTFEAEHDRTRSDFPVAPTPGADPNDVTDYDENLAQFGFGYEWGGSTREPAGRPPTARRD